MANESRRCFQPPDTVGTDSIYTGNGSIQVRFYLYWEWYTGEILSILGVEAGFSERIFSALNC